MTVPSKHLGRIRSVLNQDIMARLESLEHLSNQHDILLNAVLDIYLISMEERFGTKGSTCTSTTVEKR